MAICIKLNGDVCAESYCDFWHLEEKKCSFAVETELRIEILRVLAKRANSIENREDLKKLIKDLNIVQNSSRTIQ